MNNEIRWDRESDCGQLLKEKFDNAYALIEEKMAGRSGLVWVSSHNHPLFAASTSGDFNLDPRIKFGRGRYWLIIENRYLEKDEIRTYPDPE